MTKQFLIPWPLPANDEKKNFFETTHRLCTPEETFERFASARPKAGITRLADITKLDTLGIPTYLAVRPKVDLVDLNITVYNGKGFTKMQAKVSAMMEAFERHAAERHNRPAILANFREISHYFKVVHPWHLILAQGDTYADHEKLEWVCGTELFSGKPRWVPAASVFFPYLPVGGRKLFKEFVDTNGIASGNTLGEAISHGLSELIERDAEATGRASFRATTIDLSTIEAPLIRALIEKFETSGINLVVKEITSDIGIPSFFAVSDDPETENPLLLNRGIGTHVNAEIALMRAITETAQSRCGFISGSREDLAKEAYKRSQEYHTLKKSMSYWFEPTPPLKSFKEFKIVNNETTIEDIQIMLAALEKRGFHEVIVFNLTHPEVQVPVVRVVVPGLEPCADHKNRFGRRQSINH